jgi:putative peptidoglycan lipid II flippase
VPASASSVFNLVSIVTGVLFAYLLDPQTNWRHPHFTERALYGVSLGVLLGGLAQLSMQLPALRAAGFRMRWGLAFRDPGLRQVWVLMWPSVIAGAAVQVNVLVNGMLASEIDGARSWLNCAFRLMQFPIGIFGVAIATVTLPSVARHHARDDLGAFGRQVEESLRLALFLTIPAAVGLFALAPQIIGVIYEHGKFMAYDTAQTAAALRAYSVGLAGYASIKVLLPCFAALNLPKLPLRVSLLAIGLNLTLNLVLVKQFHMGHVGLAMTTGALALVNFAQLLFYLRREVDFGTARRWMGLVAGVGLAALLCGLVAAEAAALTEGWGHDFMGRCLALAVSMGAGIGVYGLVTLVLRVPEAQDAWRLARKIVGGRQR